MFLTLESAQTSATMMTGHFLASSLKKVPLYTMSNHITGISSITKRSY